MTPRTDRIVETAAFDMLGEGLGKGGRGLAVGLEVPVWAPRPGRDSPHLGLVAKAVQLGITRAWPGVGESPT